MAALPATKDATSSEAVQEAYEMRRKGKSIGYILDNTQFTSTHDVVQAIKAYHAEMSLSTFESRQEAVQLEIDRLDAVQEKMWEVMDADTWKYNSEGDALEPDYDARMKAAKVILDCVKQRAQLKGLTETDVSQAQAAVLIVGSKQGDYVRGLINAIPEHARPKDTEDFVLQLEADPAD